MMSSESVTATRQGMCDRCEQIASDISETSLKGIVVGISINLKPDLLKQIDAHKGTQSRSGYIVRAVYEYLNPSENGLDADKMQLLADKKQLISQIDALKDTQSRSDREISFLRDQNATLTDALTAKMLVEPKKKSVWERIRGR